jgi:two-component system sensor histidine kinase ChiS
MDEFKKKLKRFTPIRYHLTSRILMIIIPILVALGVIDYFRTEMDMMSNFLGAKEQAESAILHAVKMAESAYTLYSATLDKSMEQAFSAFLESYENAGRDPGKMDLGSLKETLGGKMDLYIIDENNIVVQTTYPTDQGLDFKTFPDLGEYLNTVRQGSGYASHRITPEIRTGKLRKYAYMPTPDQKYILELGLVSDEFNEIVKELNYLKIARELINSYPHLNDIRVFDMNGHLIGDPDMNTDEITREHIKNVAEDKMNLEIPADERGASRTYLYVRSEGGKYRMETTRVVELTWNTYLMDMELRNKARSNLAVSVIAIIGSVIMTLYISGRISQPLHKIVRDVVTIARGDLDHKIEVKEENELKILEQSINMMVNTIKDNMRKIRQYSENLEEKVKERTHRLEEANDQLELFVYSVTHDLRAPLSKIENLCTILLEEHGKDLNSECRAQAEKIYVESRRMDKLIIDLLAYGRMSRMEIQMEQVDSKAAIYRALSQLELKINEKDAEISIKGDIPDVLAHALTLQEILANLISNAIKYTAPGVKPRIVIRAEEKGGKVRIFVEDNGIGIDPQYHEKIFMLFERLHTVEEYPGTGVGLAIVKKGIEKVWGKAGLTSAPGKGSSFWIELPVSARVEQDYGG